MAKDKKAGDIAAAPTAARDQRERRLRRLERRLAAVRDLEAKRFRRFEKARRRGTRLSELVSALRAEQSAQDEDAPAPSDPHGYCMREKRSVPIMSPERVVLRNGRVAMAGVCGTCGARVFTMAGPAVAVAGVAKADD